MILPISATGAVMVELMILATGLLGIAAIANELKEQKPKKSPVPVRSKRK